MAENSPALHRRSLFFQGHLDQLRQEHSAHHDFETLRRIYREEFGRIGLRAAFSYGPTESEANIGLYKALSRESEVKRWLDDPDRLAIKVIRLGTFIESLNLLQDVPVRQIVPPPRRQQVARVHRLAPESINAFEVFHGGLIEYRDALLELSLSTAPPEAIDLYGPTAEVCKLVVPEQWLAEGEQPPEVLPATHYDSVGRYLNVLARVRV